VHFLRCCVLLCAVASGASPAAAGGGEGGGAPRPNIVLALADDWSWPHAGAYGDPVVQTPAFDQLASEGVLFTRAFAGAPSCTASRGTILSGQPMWRLQEAGDLWGTFPLALVAYTDLLKAEGYHVGFLGKSWGPGLLGPGGRTTDPCGKYYATLNDYLAARPAGAPLCLWIGSTHPHRPYVKGSGAASGLSTEGAQLPLCLPPAPAVLNDLLDYYFEVGRFDVEVAAARAAIAGLGELDDTLFVVTSDNGMPFPRCKANLYDEGLRVPLAVRWPARFPGGRVVDDFATLAELAPTFLEAAGVPVPASMIAPSLTSVLVSNASGQVDPSRDHVVVGRERHTPAQPCAPTGYPMRALRTADYLYVRNVKPYRLPAGGPTASVTYMGIQYADVDGSPSKSYLLLNDGNPALQPYFDMAFAPRPREELYDLKADPGQLVNVVDQPQYAAVRAQLAVQLTTELLASADPRRTGAGDAFDQYPYYGAAWPPNLTTDFDEYDPTRPGKATFRIKAGASFAGMGFELLGSMSGTSPGTVFGPLIVPLNYDTYLQFLLTSPGLVLGGSPGALDESGAATITLSFPVSPSAQGFFQGDELHHAFLLSDPGTSTYLATSAPCRTLLRQPPTPYCTAGTSASGCQAVLTGTGTPSASAPTGFFLSAAGVESGKSGMFFFGTSGRQAAPWGTSSSFQCVAPPVRRAGLLWSGGGFGSCEGAMAQDMNAHWLEFPGKNPGAGALVQAQLWYRDPQNTSSETSSLSNAVEFTVAP